MKHRRLPRLLRTLAAVLCLLAIGLVFLDYRNWIPASFKHAVTSIQFVPSLIALASGAALSLACMVVLVVTLLTGRIYCSTICPLGVLQDVVARIGGFWRKKKMRLPYQSAYNQVRYGVLAFAVAAVLVGWGGFALAWLDPYSHFGRFAGTLFRPLLIGINNVASSVAQHFGSAAIPHVALPWAGFGVFLPILLFLGIVVFMSVWRGRLWCNTVCPVGSLLGLLSKKALFRLVIEPEACVRCGDCLRSCKAQCIDLREQKIDFSRCVGCLNCVSVCDEGGLKFRWLGRRKTEGKKHEGRAGGKKSGVVPPVAAPGASRRDFLATLTTGALVFAAAGGRGSDAGGPRHLRHGEGGGQGEGGRFRQPRMVAPPGARSIDRFLDQCTACQLCVSACPSHVLEPTVWGYGCIEGMMKPRLNFDRSFCNINCTTCGSVCPDHAIQPLTLATKQRTRIGVARVVRSHCIVFTDGTACGACAEHCPTAALQMEAREGGPAGPVVDARYCIGCGACQFACPALPRKAVIVHGSDTHEMADVLVQEKAVAPAGADDFAF